MLMTAVSSGPSPFGIGEVQFGALLDQGARALDTSFACGVQERREASGRAIDGTRFGSHLPLPFVHRRARVDLRAASDQLPHHRRLPLRRRPHQRRLPAPLLHGVHVGAALDQQTRGVDLAGARHDHQRRLPVGVGRLDVRAGLEQRLEQRRAGDNGRLRHRRRAVVVLDVDLCAGADQPRDEIEVVALHGPMQRRRAIGFGGVDVDTLGDERQRRLAIAGLDGFDERRAAGAPAAR